MYSGKVCQRSRDAYGLHKDMVLLMEAESTFETSVNFTRIHGATTQNTIIFTLTTVKTRNVTNYIMILREELNAVGRKFRYQKFYLISVLTGY
jgi:hypothetical protein